MVLLFISNTEEISLTAISLRTLAVHKLAFNKQLELHSPLSDSSLVFYISLCSLQNISVIHWI